MFRSYGGETFNKETNGGRAKLHAANSRFVLYRYCYNGTTVEPRSAFTGFTRFINYSWSDNLCYFEFMQQ